MFSGKTMGWIAVLSMALLALKELAAAQILVHNFPGTDKILGWVGTPIMFGISLVTLAAFGAIAGIIAIITGGIGGKLLK